MCDIENQVRVSSYVKLHDHDQVDDSFWSESHTYVRSCGATLLPRTVQLYLMELHLPLYLNLLEIVECMYQWLPRSQTFLSPSPNLFPLPHYIGGGGRGKPGTQLHQWSKRLLQLVASYNNSWLHTYVHKLFHVRNAVSFLDFFDSTISSTTHYVPLNPQTKLAGLRIIAHHNSTVT